MALQERGDRFSATDKRGRSIAEFAVAGGSLPVVNFLASYGVSFAPAIFLAAQLGRTPVLEYCAEHGQDVSAVNADSRTILHIASLNGHLDTVQYIVERIPQVDGNAGDSEGNTALHLAVLKEHLEIVHFLFSVDKIEANPINVHKQSLLHFAAKIANSGILTAVLEGNGIGGSPDRVVYFWFSGIS
jgi:ankyrin repeat protein